MTIPPLQSYGQALKEENCFSGVLGDDCGASANLLRVEIPIYYIRQRGYVVIGVTAVVI